MPRRPFQVRPKELTTTLDKWEFEVFVIDKEPIQKRPVKYQFDNETVISVKDLVENLCEKLGILPVNKALFGISLDVFGGRLYLPYIHCLTKDNVTKKKLYFRMQFKVDCTRMHETDPNAFSYFLLQCRHDFVYGRFRDNLFQMSDELKKQEMLLRMLILETLLVSKDENLFKKDGSSHLQQIIKRKHPFSIENVLSKYVDDRGKSRSDEVKKCKKIIEKSLPMFESVTKPEIDFVREVGFLPEYAKETFKNLKKVYGRQDVTAIDDIWLAVHPDDGIIRMRSIEGRFKKADEKTPFQNVAYLVIKKSEIAADVPKFQLIIGKLGNQQAEVISSDSEEELLCICSWIDGYYRLFVDQYTSLLEDRGFETSIHGPIEREVCIQLMKSIECNDGDFVVREKRDKYKEFVLTVRVKGEYKHHEVHCVEEGRLLDRKYYIEEGRRFKTLEELINYYQEGKGPLRLERMIKPSRTGPVPFRNGFKAMPILKRAIPSATNIEVQLLDSKSLIRERELRKGHFGVVWKCIQRKETDSKSVAVRFLHNEISQQGFERIYQCYKRMMSRMIVRITGCSVSSENPKYLAYEYMDGGPLDLYLSSNRQTILYRTLLKFILDVAEGMKYLERDLNLVHGNLNCHNILRLANGDIKISDACFDPILQEDKNLTEVHLNMSCNWRAPEVLRGERITRHSDSWSYGMTVWEMMSLTKPFGSVTLQDMLDLILRKNLPSFDILQYCPKEIKEILSSCWNLTPEDRNNFTEICHCLDVYKKGYRSDVQTEMGTGIEKKSFPVPTHLLDRHYYSWKKEEAIEVKNEEKYARELREMKSKAWQELACSAESSISGGSSTGSGYGVIRQSDTSGYSSAACPETPRQASLPVLVGESDGDSIDKVASDIEMTDLDKREKLEKIMETHSSTLQTTTSFCIPFLEGNIESEPDISKFSSIEAEVEKYSDEIMQQSSLNEDVYVESSFHKGQVSQVKEKIARPSSVDMSCEMELIDPKSSQDSDNQDNENVTEDIMEVANVLASMAHHRTVDQKRPRRGDTGFISQKHPRTISPTPISASEGITRFTSLSGTAGKTLPLKDQSNSGFDNYLDEKVSSTDIDIDEGRMNIRSQMEFDQQMQFSSESPSELPDSEYKERKKRSHSVSEEITKMQKRAARRALDIPNPFNLGTSIPKNFLLSLKAPLALPTQKQPEDISKFFKAIPAKNTGDMTVEDDKLKPQKGEDYGYKAISDIQQLEDNFSSLKAASPGNSATSADYIPKISASQSLAYVVSPSQQGNMAEQSNIQSTISAYLSNLGQSLVAGNPVIIPQLTVSAAPGQTIGTAPFLQVLQAQQKVSQLTQTISQNKPDHEKLSDGSLPIATPDYLQTLFTILAAKNIHAPAVSSSQHTVSSPVAATVQQSHLVSTATGTHLIAGTNYSPHGKANETVKKIIDIKPRPVSSSVAIKQSSTDIVMIPVQNSNGQRLSQTSSSSINVMQSIDECKPVSVKGISSQRPLLLDSRLQPSRPLFIKRDPSPQSIRSQHLILPKNLPEQLGRIEQSKLAPKPVLSLPARHYIPDANKGIMPTNDIAVSEIKVEPSSPRSQGYTFHPSSQLEKTRNLKVPKSHRRKSGESQAKNLFFSQLGDLKIFRKEDLTLEKKLGEGQFGEVWRAILKFQGDGSIKQCPVAVKKLKSDDRVPLSIIEEFKNEVRQMASLNNDYIVKLIGVSVDPSGDLNDPLIITELMPHGSLKHFIANHKGTIVEEILLTFAVQIAQGMEFLQSRRIVHRDLAARNVLVESRDRVKVCDFGLSRMFGEKGYYRSHNGKALIPVRWFAPESIKEQKFTAESDVWSYGVTIWEMFELWDSDKEFATPYENLKPNEILGFLERGNRLTKPKKCSDELWAISIGCWRYSPDERHSFYRLSDEIRRLLPIHNKVDNKLP